MGLSPIKKEIDCGALAVGLARDVDRIHIDKLQKITDSLEHINYLFSKFSSLKRTIEAKNDGKSNAYDITDLHESLIDFQNFFNENVLDREKLNFDNEGVYKSLKTQSSKELEVISKKIEDGLNTLKDTASDQSNQIYIECHLYTIIMNIFQELTRTDCRGRVRIAQASRSH